MYKNITKDVMEQTNDVGIHEDDNIMKFQASIPSIVNTLKKNSFHKRFIIGLGLTSLMKIQ